MIQSFKKILGEISADTLSYLSEKVIAKEFDLIASEFYIDVTTLLNVEDYYLNNSHYLIGSVDSKYLENYEIMCAELFNKYHSKANYILIKNDSLVMLLLNKKNFIEKYTEVAGRFQQYTIDTFQEHIKAVAKSAVLIKGEYH